VGSLHIDARSDCSWMVEHAGVVQTVWVDGTQEDRTHQPVDLQLDGHPMAQDGQSMQALQSYGVAGKPSAGCPVPASA